MAEVLPLSNAEKRLLEALSERQVRFMIVGRIGATELAVLPLAQILASKEAANRAKDRLVIAVLRDALRSAGESGGSPANG